MIRIPSLFRPAKYKSFSYTPRHYDPVKEEIAERTKRIQQELSHSDNENSYVSSISGSFRRKTERQGFSPNYSVGLLQLVIAIVLLSTFVGYVFYGNLIFYILLLAVPVYLYFRVKGMLAKRSSK